MEPPADTASHAFAQHLCLDTLAMRRQSCPALLPMASVSTGMRGNHTEERALHALGTAGQRVLVAHDSRLCAELRPLRALTCPAWRLRGAGQEHVVRRG